MAYRQSFPVFLVLSPFRDLAPSVRVLLRTLDRLAPHIPYAEGYYRSDSDEALLGLQFDAQAVERMGTSHLLEVVGRCNLPVIVPETMTPSRRARFYDNHLHNFPTYVQQYRSPSPDEPLLPRVVAALEEHAASQPEEQGDDYESVEVSVDEELPDGLQPESDQPRGSKIDSKIQR